MVLVLAYRANGAGGGVRSLLYIEVLVGSLINIYKILRVYHFIVLLFAVTGNKKRLDGGTEKCSCRVTDRE
jgi:hypothetical protein